MPNNLHPESRAYLETVRANYMVLDNKECTAKINVKKVVFIKLYDIKYVCVVSNNE